MKVAVAYCFPALNRAKYGPLAQRFAQTWQQFPPGYDCDLTVYCNGVEPGPIDRQIFGGLPCQFVARDNSGLDIGCFQQAAKTLPCDLLVCFGAPVHFHRAGWLARMVDAYVEHGIGLYGCAAYLSPNWHVRTTAFWMPTMLLQSYPALVGSNRQSRYEFEHGPTSFTRHALGLDLPVLMVTWDGIYPLSGCTGNPFSSGTDNSPGVNSILVRDQHIHT